MESVSKLLSPGAFFEFENLKYEVAPWNMKIQAEFEKYFVSKAWSNLANQRSYMSEDDYKEAQRMLRQDIDEGLYSWESELTKRALNQVVHNKHLAFLCLAYGASQNKDAPRVSKELVEKIYKDIEKANELTRVIIEVNRDPNLKGEMKSQDASPDFKS